MMWSKRQPDKGGDITKKMADKAVGGRRERVSYGENMPFCGSEARSVYFWCLSSGVTPALHYVGAVGLVAPHFSAQLAHRGR